MEGTKRYMKIILMVHQKNIVFFLFITVKGPKRYMELKINGFIQKNTWLV